MIGSFALAVLIVHILQCVSHLDKRFNYRDRSVQLLVTLAVDFLIATWAMWILLAK